MATHYDVLGLQSSVCISEVRLAFKQRALVLHPDKGGSKEAFQEALLAFEILSDPASRRSYDTSLLIQDGQKTVGKLAKPAARSTPKACAGCKLRQSRKRKAGSQAKKGWHATAIKANLQRSFAQPSQVHPLDSCMSGKRRKRSRAGATQDLLTPRFYGNPVGSPSRCPVKKMNMLLSRIFHLLRRLSPQSRRRAFERNFTQQQRLTLEMWAKSSGNVNDRRSPSNHSFAPFASDEDLRTQASVDTAGHDELRHGNSGGIPADESFEASEESEDTCVCGMSIEDRLDEGIKFDEKDEDDDLALDCKQPHVELEDCSVNEVSRTFSSSERQLYSRGHVRGVAWKIRRSKPYYQANVCVDTFYMVSREVLDLDAALDALVVLTIMKQHVLRCDGTSFEDRVRRTVPMVLKEYGMTAEQLGLGFHTMISMRFWIYPPLHTPHQHSLDTALRSWSLLAPFRKVTSEGSARELARKNPMELHEIWQRFRTTYLDILEAHGKCRQWNSSRLDALEDAARPNRERRLERWNRLHMNTHDRVQYRSRRVIAALRPQEYQAARDARAERRNQIAMAAEERRIWRLYEEERRLERRENRAMAAEDARSRACRRCEFKEESLIRRIVRLLRGLQPLHRRLERYQERLKRDGRRAARMSQSPPKIKRKEATQFAGG